MLHEAVTELACRRIEMMEGGRRKKGKNRKQRRKRTPKRKKRMFLDVDGLPVEVHGRQTGSEWSGYYRQTMVLGLVASCGETGDLIDGELYPGASYLGNRALKLTLRVVDRCRGRLCGSMIVRMDAGFPEPGLLEGLEKRGVPYIARIRKNKVLDQMAKPHLTQPAVLERASESLVSRDDVPKRRAGTGRAGWCWWCWSDRGNCIRIISGC